MTRTIAQIVADHLSIWNSPADDDRLRAIASTYASNVLVAEPEAVHRGHDGVASAIDGLGAAPGMQLTRSSEIQTTQELSTYSWSFGPAGGPPVVTGRDVITVEEHLVTRVYVVIDAPQT